MEKRSMKRGKVGEKEKSRKRRVESRRCEGDGNDAMHEEKTEKEMEDGGKRVGREGGRRRLEECVGWE